MIVHDINVRSPVSVTSCNDRKVSANYCVSKNRFTQLYAMIDINPRSQCVDQGRSGLTEGRDSDKGGTQLCDKLSVEWG